MKQVGKYGDFCRMPQENCAVITCLALFAFRGKDLKMLFTMLNGFVCTVIMCQEIGYNQIQL